jgi:hypothetical protein
VQRQRATPAATVAAAGGLVCSTTANYGVAARWINNDPRRGAVNKPIWHRHVEVQPFAGNVIAAAGCSLHYGNGRAGECPNANQLTSGRRARRAARQYQSRALHARRRCDMPNMTPESARPPDFEAATR